MLLSAHLLYTLTRPSEVVDKRQQLLMTVEREIDRHNPPLDPCGEGGYGQRARALFEHQAVGLGHLLQVGLSSGQGLLQSALCARARCVACRRSGSLLQRLRLCLCLGDALTQACGLSDPQVLLMKAVGCQRRQRRGHKQQ